MTINKRKRKSQRRKKPRKSDLKHLLTKAPATLLVFLGENQRSCCLGFEIGSHTACQLGEIPHVRVRRSIAERVHKLDVTKRFVRQQQRHENGIDVGQIAFGFLYETYTRKKIKKNQRVERGMQAMARHTGGLVRSIAGI